LVLKLDEAPELRVFVNELFVETINVKTDFIEKEVNDSQIVKDKLSILGYFLQADLDKLGFLYNFSQCRLAILFKIATLCSAFEPLHNVGHDFFLLD